MTTRFAWRGVALCSLAAALAGASGVRAADVPTSPSDAEIARYKELVGQRLTFSAYAFSTTDFPKCEFEQPEKAKELLGGYTIRTTFYDYAHRPVSTAEKPGPYAAVIEVTPQKGRPLHRFMTLYRLAAEPAEAPADLLDELARIAALRRDVIARQAALVDERIKGHTLAQEEKDPKFARLLAGLAESKSGKDAVRKSADAYAAERQWWVELKRKLTGFDKLYPRAFVGPQRVTGTPARVVHAGTLAEAGMKPDAAERIDAACQAWSADTDQAFAVCIVRHGVVVLHKAYGMRDGAPMTVDTPSWMASITKAMSASLMWQMVDQGIVNLDDRVDKYLPALRDVPSRTPLTLRHLYTHTSGLHQWPGWNDELPDVPELVADYLPVLGIGKEWGYNGTGFIVGGKILEMISGEAVPQFYQKHLLTPLEMTHTDVIGTHADTYSTPLDTARWAQMLLNGGAYGSYRFFRKETFEQMLPQKLTMLLGPEATKTFGIGLDGSAERFGHGAASAATFSVDRKRDLVVIMTRNAIGTNYDKYNGKFWQAIDEGVDPAN